MIIKIVKKPEGANWPENKLAEAELVLQEGPLQGLKLRGFSIWRSKQNHDETYVQCPGRQYTSNGKPATWLHIVNADEGVDMLKPLKAQINHAFEVGS